jgi:hypothetical protein
MSGIARYVLSPPASLSSIWSRTEKADIYAASGDGCVPDEFLTRSHARAARKVA